MNKRKPGRPKKAKTTIYPLRLLSSMVNDINRLKKECLLEKGEIKRVCESAIEDHISTIEQYKDTPIGFEKPGYTNDLMKFPDEK